MLHGICWPVAMIAIGYGMATTMHVAWLKRKVRGLEADLREADEINMVERSARAALEYETEHLRGIAGQLSDPVEETNLVRLSVLSI